MSGNGAQIWWIHMYEIRLFLHQTDDTDIMHAIHQCKDFRKHKIGATTVHQCIPPFSRSIEAGISWRREIVRERERERNGQHSSSRTPKIVCVSRTASMARRGKLWIIRGMWRLMGSTAPALIVVDVEILTMTQGETSWLCMTFLADPYLSFFNHLTCQTGSWRS